MPEGVELAVAYISVVPEGSRIAPEIRRQFGKVDGEATRAGKSASKKFGGAFGGGLKLLGGAAIGGGIISFLKDSNAEAREAQKVGALTNQVIKTTRGAANISAKAVDSLSNALSKKVGIDDEIIQSGENVLLTFKNVRNELGKSNQIFNRATKASVDLATTPLFGGDIAGASKQLGKALNDPLLGITALNRAGVQFSARQKDQIKTLVKSGKTLQAQKIILKEVESQVGGAAAAQATAGDKAAVSIKNLKEQIGTALLPVVDKMSRFISKKAVPAISDFIKEFQAGKGTAGDIRDALEDVVSVGKGVLKFFNGLPGPVKKFAVEGAAAYLVLSKFRSLMGGSALIGGLKNFTGGLANAETRMGTVAGASQKLGRGIRNLAGVGGILALQDASNRSSKAMGGLEGAIGGALTGFAVSGGNPFGALIGAAGGGLLGVFTSGNQAKISLDKFGQTAQEQLSSVDAFASSVDDVTGAFTRLTKQEAAKELLGKHAFKNATKLGLSYRQVTAAALGNEKAVAQVTSVTAPAIAAAKNLVKINANNYRDSKTGAIFTTKEAQAIQVRAGAAQDLADAIGGVTKNSRAGRIAALSLSLAEGKLAKVFGSIPDSKIIKIATEGDQQAKADIIDLAARGKGLSDKQVRVLLKTAGLPRTKADIAAVQTAADHLNGKVVVVTVVTKTTNATVAEGNLPPFPGGRDGKVSTPYPRKLGGTVRKGFPYIVGEQRPELFVPNQAGRIQPRPAASMPVSTGGKRVALTITNWRDGTGHFEEIADSRVDSAAAMRGETDRAL